VLKRLLFYIILYGAAAGLVVLPCLALTVSGRGKKTMGDGFPSHVPVNYFYTLRSLPLDSPFGWRDFFEASATKLAN